MTQPEESLDVSENEPSSTATEPGVAPAEPEAAIPVPWTPERVTEWNSYYDLYVILGALLLVFAVTAVRVNQSTFWTHLRSGQLIADQASPITTDPFSYTESGQSWVNIPWLFQWANAAIFKLVQDLVPVDPTDPTANRSSAEQIAVGVLVGLNALVRLFTAWILIRIVRPGPGRWWTAVCAVIALGVVYGPLGVVLGGVASWASVSPSTWGLLLLAIELLLLHRAYNLGKRVSLFGLVPLFLVWANVDESFLLGLMVLAAAAVGRLLDGKTAGELVQSIADREAARSQRNGDGAAASAPARPVGIATGLIVLAACAAVCLTNPSLHRAYFAALSPVFQLFAPADNLLTYDQLSYFGKGIREQAQGDWYKLTIYYLLTVAVGLGSFLLNSRRFSWSRFLPFALLAICWGSYIRFAPEFAVVFSAVVGLNGQEWYQDRFGTRGRLGTGWTLWSTGGRLLTLAALFFFVAVAITGWRKSPGAPRFGFGYDADDFSFEAAEHLAGRDDIKGNILNTTLAQGDALIWKGYPARKTFIDGRTNLFPRDLLVQHHLLRNALRDDNLAVWKPVLDKYGVSVVMIEAANAQNTYRRLMQSPAWIPFYDDGRVVLFGRSDAAEPDLAAFKSNRLEPDLRAYRVAKPVPSADRPPTATTWIDEIFQNRLLAGPQSHNDSAQRWLQGAGANLEQPAMPDPARCLLAIREARTALAKNPDDWMAYRVLDLAYRLLAVQETALLAGIKLVPENQGRIASIIPSPDLSTRFRQRMTSLNYAIQTTPPPKTPQARKELINLNLSLFELCLQAGFVDLARDRLQILLDLAQPDDFPVEQRAQFQQQLEQLNQRVKQIEDNLSDLQIERQASPVEKGLFALNQGALGLALSELEEADRSNMSPAVVKPQLIDLFCTTGQPDRALELISVGTGEDPNLGSEPGMSFLRQGQIYLLLGNYLSASSLWGERAIPRLRFDRSMRALSGGQILGSGDLVTATSNSLTLPSLITRQALWEFDLAQALLEAGSPDQAAEHYTRALTLAPDFPFRPIIAYYLEKMGKPVPAAKADSTPAAKPASPVDRILGGSPLVVPRSPASPATVPDPSAKPETTTKPEAAKKP